MSSSASLPNDKSKQPRSSFGRKLKANATKAKEAKEASVASTVSAVSATMCDSNSSCSRSSVSGVESNLNQSVTIDNRAASNVILPSDDPKIESLTMLISTMSVKEKPIILPSSSSQIKSPTFTTYLEHCSKEAVKENDREMLVSIDNKDKDLIKRIENHRREKMTDEEQAAHTVASILESLKSNAVLRSFFRKDPTRQTLHEKAQIDWIRKYKYPDVYKMNADTNGICFSKNRLHRITKASPRPPDATKTIDVCSPASNMYAFLKHTSLPGGAQDNQYNDIKQFIVQVVGYLTETSAAEEIFEFYLDGKYYTEKKKAELNAMIPASFKKRILITNCQEIPASV
jgi:hypothetical protein